MTPERWQRVKAVLEKVLECEPGRRAAFLQELCGSDESLRGDVEFFITSNEHAGSFIESAALKRMAESASDLQAQLQVGQSFGPYQIARLLGRGGMGEIYLAEDNRLGRKVALKLLPSYFAKDRERVIRFQREARAASALNHPNILTIYEIGEIDSREFIATEFVEGRTLRGALLSGTMKITEAIDIAVQVASALAAAHEAGIVHRDIKPENIMIRRDGLVKVVDFGLAKLTEPDNEDAGAMTLMNTHPGLVMGTTAYMSPEQARGQKVDWRSDLFSLGVVLYEMVSGRAPFQGKTTPDLVAAILEKEPPPLSHHTNGPRPLLRVVTKALRKNVEDRYQRSSDMLSDLKALREHRPEKRAAGALAIVLALVIVAAIAVVYSSFTARGKPIDSLAVLPLINTSGDANSEYLSDGITENLIYTTSRLPNLRVVPRSSVFRYKGKDLEPQAAGRQLDVRAVLSGRLVQHGDDLSISVELIDVRDNSLVWGQQFKRKVTDILGMQEEIAKDISERLRVRLTSEDMNRLASRATNDAEAYRLYLKGRYYWNKRTREGYKRAAENFEQAIDKDPSYALAYTGLADSYDVLPSYGMLSPKESFSKGKAAAANALRLRSDLAEAATSAAYIKYFYDWNWAEAENEFNRALEIDPAYSTAHQWYALELAAMGRMDEAVREIKRAQELDPLALISNVNAGWTYYFARRFDQAIEEDRKSLDMDPNFARGHWAISEPLEQQGRYAEAIAELEKAGQLDETPIMSAFLGHIYAVSGKKAEARKVLDRLAALSKDTYVDPYFIAEIHAALGERDQAFADLEIAYNQRSSSLVWLKVEPKFDSLRSDPRFSDLLMRIGLRP